MNFKALYLFCGIGGGALGFQEAREEFNGKLGRIETLAGIDADPEACADFEAITGAPAFQMDLFDREQYTKFHSHEPPDEWKEITPYDIWRATNGEAPDVVFTSPPCLPGKELILTPNGERPIETLRSGDFVLTHKGHYRRVLKVGTHNFEGKIYGIRLNGTVDFREFTAEHPILRRKVVRNISNGGKRELGESEFVRAEELKVGDRIGFPIEKSEKGCAKRFIDSFGDPAAIERGGYNLGKRYEKPRHIAKNPRTVDIRQFANDPDLWFLLGAYIGDGYRRSSQNEVIFCVGHSDGELAIRIRSILSKFNISWNEDEYSGKSNVKLRIHAKHLCEIARSFGDGAENKKIPPQLMNIETPFLQALIEGYRWTDGSEQPRRIVGRETLQARWKIASVSFDLLKQMQRLLLRIRVFGSIHKCWSGGKQVIEGRIVQTRPRWELNVRLDPMKRTVYEFDDNTVWVRIREIKVRDAIEQVWNLEVEEDNTFCVHLMATHNCKGFSGLLPEKSAKSQKYQALNKLTVRGIRLILEAFEHDLPKLFLLENVPRITTRGKQLLDEIKNLLQKFGYAVSDGFHDCGEIGGLGQHRKRYLLIARNEKKMPAFVYQPPKKRLKTIGEVIGPLPMPDDTAGGPMHRLPRLAWKTWVRLALIPAGGDWRDLQNIEYEKYRLVHTPRAGAMAIEDWNETSRTVTGGAGFGRSNGVSAIADPRVKEQLYPSGYGVQDWNETSTTIRAAGRVMNAPVSINDPRLNINDDSKANLYRIQKWDETGNCITGAIGPSNGAACINDPRLEERNNRHPGVYQVVKWEEAGPCVTGTRFGSGAPAISDPRLQNGSRYTNKWQIHAWDETAATVTGTTDIQSGALSIGDPRINCSPRSGTYGVMPWDKPGKTVIGAGDIHAGSSAVADPRIPDDNENGVWVIISEDGTRHRPLTTYELAMIQGFPTHLPDGRPFQLSGNSDARWRERIGNAVPPDAAKAIAEVMLIALMASKEGMWVLGSTDIWVMPEDDSNSELIVS